ncbi:MAG: chemotaxis protein CheW, partial [Oscillospiraceae bacterium]|nr:chemotaxis protein CheW [Oscillospiraceae bacterium]
MNSVIAVDDDLDGKYLTFFIGEATYGVELIHVIEIISVQNITNVPGIPTYIQGIINLR